MLNGSVFQVIGKFPFLRRRSANLLTTLVVYNVPQSIPCGCEHFLCVCLGWITAWLPVRDRSGGNRAGLSRYILGRARTVEARSSLHMCLHWQLWGLTSA